MSAGSLLDRVRAGDADALDELARAELPRVHRLLLRILGPRPDMDDLVQTVFLETCRALPRFRGESTLSTFVGGITVQVAKRTLRPSAWQRRRAEMPAAEPAAARAAPDDTAHARSQLRLVRELLAELPAAKQIAFSLWAFEGLSPARISELTGASVSSVRSRIFQAQRHLKQRARSDPRLADLQTEDDDAPR